MFLLLAVTYEKQKVLEDNSSEHFLRQWWRLEHPPAAPQCINQIVQTNIYPGIDSTAPKLHPVKDQTWSRKRNSDIYARSGRWVSWALPQGLLYVFLLVVFEQSSNATSVRVSGYRQSVLGTSAHVAPLSFPYPLRPTPSTWCVALQTLIYTRTHTCTLCCYSH